LNRGYEDSRVALINNDILSNRMEGIYVVNTASYDQLQFGSSDPLTYADAPFSGSDAAFRTPNIELRVQDNLIESNGNSTLTSTVPVQQSEDPNDRSATPDADWTHNSTQISGTLGGLVIRVGTVDSIGVQRSAVAGFELGRSGVSAEVWRNSFDGNFGADVYFDNFTSSMVRLSRDNFSTAQTPNFRWLDGYRDPLSRFNLSFRENAGNSLDVLNGFAYYDNWESLFKSRDVQQSTAPNAAINPLPPAGHFNNPGRRRNATRTIGRADNAMGDAPGSYDFGFVDWSYDGTGTSTWRVESDFDFGNFSQTSPTLGFSSFFTEVSLGNEPGERWDYQWDTGINTPTFTGLTPYSLQRGDIFNVRAGEAPISADELEGNNSFASAHNLGTVSGAGYSVNAQTLSGNLNMHLKGDRDYYRFTAAGTGAMVLNLNALDALGDNLSYLIYRVDSTRQTEEVPMFTNPDGSPSYFTAVAGGSRAISTNVVAGQEYIIEILSDEGSNNAYDAGFDAFGKSFVYGTSRSYSLTLNAPAGPLSAPSTTTTGSGGATSGSSVTINPGVVQGSSTAIVAAANVPGAAPTAKFVAVSPDPRSTSAGTVTLNFTEDVTGVGISDFRLTRNGVNIPLSSSLLRRVNAAQYTINLSTLTGEAGTYKISLVASGSGIADTDSVLLTSSASDTWVVSNTVTTGSDTPDVNVGDGIARDSNGAVSLRAAIMEANATPGSDVILLGSRTHTLSRDGRYEDLAFTGDLDILGDLTIRGVSATTTIINANDLDRVFHIASGRTLTLENLTITGGEAFDGGAIFNSGTLILNNVNIRANEAYNQGGGIYNAGTGRITATGSSISQNLAGSRGGAVHNMGTGTYVSTTFSTNVAVSRGGGLFNEGSSARSTLLNVTMANNVTGSRGGGLYSESSASTTIGNSILQANLTDGRVPSTNATIGKDMFGGVVSRGNNIIQTLDRRFTSATTAGLLTSDRFGRDATPLASALNSLTYSTGNGVGVHTLRATGIAVDAGNNSLYPTTPLVNQLDAIGNPRLIEGNKDGVVTIDVGAVELLVNIPVAIFTATPNPAGLNQVITLTGTGSTHSNPASGRIVRWQWDFDYSSSAGFRPDAEGATTTHSYTDASRSSYVVRLLVTDNFGNTGFFDRTITVGKPTKPVVQRPFSVTTDRTPLIRWTASPATYRVQVVRVTSSGRTTVVNQSNLTSTSYNVTTSLSDGNYEVIVTATNGSGSTASSAWKFSVVAVTPTSPMVRTFDVTPLFTWGAVPGTSRYEIWIRQTAPVYVDTVFRSSTLSTPSYEATTSLGLGTFDWTVRAYDADGVAGNWFKTQTFKTERPTLSRPLSVTVDTTPTFTWNDMDAKPAGQKDTRYELWVNQIGGRAKIIHQTSLTSTSYTPTTALPNGSFEAWVRAIAPDGEAGLWSSVRRFTMDYRIGPVVSAPTGTVTDRTPTFRWQAADGARSYDLWVNNLTTGKSQVIRVIVPHVANASTISYTPAAELLSGDYRWWVRTIAVSGDQTAWSSGLNFTIPRPAITAPLGAITTDLPRFTWTGVSQYVSYELWVNNLTTGTQKIIYEKGLTTTSYQTVLPLENGSFRAYVRGVDAAGNFSEWSPQGNFTVTVGVGTAPTILSPRNSVFTAGSRPTFFWNAGTVGSSYEILVKRISDSSQPIVINQRGIQGTSFTTTTGLSAGTYRWWVRALDSTGNGLPWSQPAIFQVVSNDVNESAPVDLPNADSALMAVLTVQAENWSPDAVRSISVHPAEMVMQVEPSAAVAESFVRVQQTPIASTEEVADIDNFMEDFAESALFLSADDVMTPGVALNDSVAPVQNSVATSNVSVSEDDHHTLNLVMAGLVAGSVISTRKRSDDDQN
jgi:hypothetical protein